MCHLCALRPRGLVNDRPGSVVVVGKAENHILAARLAWLRERQQWIAEEQAYARDLAAVRATLRNVCHADRPSQAEQIADRWLRGQAAMRELQARWWEIDTPLTREEVETIWPDELDDEAWARIRKRKERARYRVPVNTYHPEWIAEELV